MPHARRSPTREGSSDPRKISNLIFRCVFTQSGPRALFGTVATLRSLHGNRFLQRPLWQALAQLQELPELGFVIEEDVE